MSGLIVVLLTIYFASRKDKEQWLFDRKRLTILALMFVIIGISWGLNDKIMKDPRNQNIRSDLLFNYSFPLLIGMLGLFIKEIPRWGRIVTLSFGFMIFGYLAMHYLIGFHNPYWENLQLSPLYWLPSD
ncbi:MULTISPECIES: hypothetical protein [Enterococcus]|jgi:hypothetical protein|uniref:hypothetical protein n=1 Tax=Enterococcus TaxID=1350 RepID=UPI0001B6D721|nr:MULTISPECIES: hypothetical protein [Enterococcus]EEV29054.1 predicted protein [Enterococcus casseliflavus EC30]EEV35385.1 predicted protein [Enterococcus casseliflavus EC10]MDK4450622.1 hypothetical protein [Enterococcus casseliflavus]MDO0894535.1 hypothetical protein [Enterococcus sp. B1E4]MDO0907489.1 hypothetical protein [Enterococcus sp. B2E4]